MESFSHFLHVIIICHVALGQLGWNVLLLETGTILQPFWERFTGDGANQMRRSHLPKRIDILPVVAFPRRISCCTRNWWIPRGIASCYHRDGQSGIYNQHLSTPQRLLIRILPAGDVVVGSVDALAFIMQPGVGSVILQFTVPRNATCVNRCFFTLEHFLLLLHWIRSCMEKGIRWSTLWVTLQLRSYDWSCSWNVPLKMLHPVWKNAGTTTAVFGSFLISGGSARMRSYEFSTWNEWRNRTAHPHVDV